MYRFSRRFNLINELGGGIWISRTTELCGQDHPFLGTHPEGDGVNFVLFSRHATRVRLEFFDHAGDKTPSRVIELDPIRHRTGDVWHVWVRSIHAGQLYAYRIEGPYRPQEGHRFNVNKLLLDPFATALTHLVN